MSILDKNILTISEPTIELEPFTISDIESQDGQDRSKNKDKLSKFVGDAYPGIRINGYDFQKEDVIVFELILDEFIPKLNVTLRDSKGVFTISQYPKDGDVLELIIKSKDEEVYKGIRMDFDIIDSDSIPVETEEQGSGTTLGTGQKYSFSCQAKIPGLLSEKCESYGSDTSFNHLQTIIDSLQLGFASNVLSTNDKQVRFCACETKLNCLQREILHSYKDDNSFFTATIDPYYYLNFVDLNKQLQFDGNVEDTLTSLMDSVNEKEMADETNVNKIEKKLVLTNRKEEGAGSATFISKYGLVNNAGLIFLKNGYKRVVQYYDQIERDFKEFTLDTLTSDNIPENYAPLKGKSDEDRYKTEIKYKYLGIQSDSNVNGNVHTNYNYALIQNFQNIEELEKLMLKVILPTANMSLYRFQQVPVAIYEMNATRTENIKQKADKSGITQKENEIADGKKDKPNNPKLNVFYSGFYIINKIKYIYRQSRGTMEQELILSRREWPIAI